MSGEQFYDEEIAPALLDLAKACQERGIPFTAMVEYAPGEFGSTGVLVGQSDAMMLASFAQKARGNIDSLVIGWARYVRESGRGHGSIVLQQAGVPALPSTEGA